MPSRSRPSATRTLQTVAGVLERRVSLANDASTKLTILQKLGSIYLDRVRDPVQAVATWKRVLDIQPGHPKALRVLRDSLLADGDYDGLTELYALTQDWEGLAEVLSAAADKATDPDLKVELSLRCATSTSTSCTPPSEHSGATSECCRSSRTTCARPPRSSRSMSKTRSGKASGPLRILLAHSSDLEGRLALLGKLVDVHGRKLQDRASAFVWATQAYELAPEREGALAAFEGAAVDAGKWDRIRRSDQDEARDPRPRR